jgi:hypothetical protein
MDPNGTGPWGIKNLEQQLGPATNHGGQFRVPAIGGSALMRDSGPYSFRCGCTAEVIGVGGTLMLSPCGPAHRALSPKWTV